VDPEGLVENSVKGYFKEMGNVFLGYKDAAVSTVTGIATVVAHPINTAKGIGNAVVHPVETAKAIMNDYGDKLQTTRGQGSIVGEILIDVATGGTVKAVSKSGKVGSLLNKITSKSKTLKKILNKTDDVVNKLDDVATKTDNIVNKIDDVTSVSEKTIVKKIKNQVNKNSRSYDGDSHVYVIRDADDNVLKVGKSSQGTRIKDGASKRAEQQVRALNKKYGPGHTSEIRKTFDNSGKALDYEKKLRDRIRRRYGKDKLPLNKEHLRGKKKQ